EIFPAVGLPRHGPAGAGCQGAGVADADPRLDPPPRPGAGRAHGRDIDGAGLRSDGDREAARDGRGVGRVTARRARNPPANKLTGATGDTVILRSSARSAERLEGWKHVRCLWPSFETAARGRAAPQGDVCVCFTLFRGAYSAASRAAPAGSTRAA